MRTAVKLNRAVAAVLLGLVVTGRATAQETSLPDAATALAAWEAFRAAPASRLDRTGPFLDFIRSSGEVHILLNDNLLAWMHDPIDPARKAVLYAAYLGGNMAAQLAGADLGSDNVAGMAGALDAYRAIRTEHPDFELTLFERLGAAQDDDTFAEVVERIAAGGNRE